MLGLDAADLWDTQGFDDEAFEVTVDGCDDPWADFWDDGPIDFSSDD